jgi:hypothetical protein
MRCHDGSDNELCLKFCENIRKSETEIQSTIIQLLGMKAWAIDGESKLIETEKGETDEE